MDGRDLRIHVQQKGGRCQTDMLNGLGDPEILLEQTFLGQKPHSLIGSKGDVKGMIPQIAADGDCDLFIGAVDCGGTDNAFKAAFRIDMPDRFNDQIIFIMGMQMVDGTGEVADLFEIVIPAELDTVKDDPLKGLFLGHTGTGHSVFADDHVGDAVFLQGFGLDGLVIKGQKDHAADDMGAIVAEDFCTFRIPTVT